MASLGRVEFGTIEVIAHMPRCRDCKWWTPLTNAPAWEGEWGDCGAITETTTHGPAAIAWAHEEGAALFTRPDFGCVKFEAKP